MHVNTPWYPCTTHRSRRLAYEDSESTHRLRDTSESTLRAEVARLQAAAQLGNQDVQVRRCVGVCWYVYLGV